MCFLSSVEIRKKKTKVMKIKGPLGRQKGRQRGDEKGG
jgi:hypothetical protein